MFIPSTYEEVKKDFPEETKEVLNSIRKSRSPKKNFESEKFNWGYEMITEISGCSFMEAISGQQTSTNHFYLKAILNTFEKSSEKLDREPEVYRLQREQREAEDAIEQARIDNLTDEERQAEIDDLIGQLDKSPGFTSFKL